MASNTKKKKAVDRRKRTKAGRERKRKNERDGTTPPRAELIPPEEGE